MFRSGLCWAILVGLVGLSRVAGATTVAGGSLSLDTVWTAANSPYVLQGDLTVPSGKTLTIQPGVEVQLMQGDTLASGLDAGRTELTINGTLLAQGSAQSPIVFHYPGSTAISLWYGVVAGATASSVVLTHVDIENALRGIDNRAPGNVLALSSSLLSYNGWAIWLQNGNITLDSLLITGNQFAGVQAVTQAAADVTFLLQNSVVSSNTQSGVTLVGVSGHTVQATLESSTVNANSGGIQASVQSTGQATVTIRNCIVSSNQAFGINAQAGGLASATITYSDVWGNGANFANTSAGTGCVSVDPLFVASPSNLQLTATSPCRDIGSPALAPDHDYLGAPRPQGTGFDLGAYEYPAAVGGAGGGGAGQGGSGAGAGGTNTSVGGTNASAGGTNASAGDTSGAGVAGNAGADDAGSGGEPASAGASASASGAANEAGNSASAGESAVLGSAGDSSTAGASPSSSDSGCGCAVVGSRTNNELWLALGALALFAFKRGKRA
jgi:hypothetical protein